MKKIPSGYRLSGACQEPHGASIYCSAWSNDLYESTTTFDDVDYADGNHNSNINSDSEDKNNNRDKSPNKGKDMESIIGELSPQKPQSKKVKVVLLRYMATCGGNYVTIYEVGPTLHTNASKTTTDTSNTEGITSEGNTTGTNDNFAIRSTSSSGLKVQQTYIDADEEEIFYACAFGGRSAGTAATFGYQPKGSYEITATTPNGNHNEEYTDPSNKCTSDDGNSSDDDFTACKRVRRKVVSRVSKQPHTNRSSIANKSAEISFRKRTITDSRDNKTSNINNSTSFLSYNDKKAQSLVDLSNYNGPQLCCVAGKRGIIKIIDTSQRRLLFTLVGHGADVYDLKFSPIDPWLLVSASKDESLRLWNVQTATCVIIFAGHEGHCDSVLSAAWHPLGHSIVSSGMDTTVKIWSLEVNDAKCAIEESYLVKPKSRCAQHHFLEKCNGDNRKRKFGYNAVGDGDDHRQYFRALCQQLPMFSSNKMHTDYVDCVQFIGDLVLSKSITNTISLWKPDFTVHVPMATKDTPSPSAQTHQHHHHHKNAAAHVLPLRDFDLTNCDIWFVRFQANESCTMLAAGNCIGEIRVWEIGGSSHHPCRKHFCSLSHFRCTSTVRMVSFSPPIPQSMDENEYLDNGGIKEVEDYHCLIATCDDGTLWKWDTK